MIERDELLERLLELKGKVPLSASDWELINQVLADPTLKKDLEMLELLDTLEDEARLQASDNAAFLRFQSKLDRHQNKKVVDSESPPRKSDPSWWAAITKPRRPWGLPVVLAQLALVAVYFNVGDGRLPTEDRVEIYRSSEQFDPCEVVRAKFDPDVTIEEITEVLNKAGLSIVGGPLEDDQYLILRRAYDQRILNELLGGLGVLIPNTCDSGVPFH